jgi:hypothetical protein
MLLMSSDFFANIAPDIVAIAAGHLFYSHVNLGHVIQRKSKSKYSSMFLMKL